MIVFSAGETLKVKVVGGRQAKKAGQELRKTALKSASNKEFEQKVQALKILFKSLE